MRAMRVASPQCKSATNGRTRAGSAKCPSTLIRVPASPSPACGGSALPCLASADRAGGRGSDQRPASSAIARVPSLRPGLPRQAQRPLVIGKCPLKSICHMSLGSSRSKRTKVAAPPHVPFPSRAWRRRMSVTMLIDSDRPFQHGANLFASPARMLPPNFHHQPLAISSAIRRELSFGRLLRSASPSRPSSSCLVRHL